jgi:transposase
MLYFGVDPHSLNHVICSCNQSSQYNATKTIKAEIEGYSQALNWAKEQSDERVWGIENPKSYGRGFAQYLVSKGETVFDVPPHFTGQYRKRSTSRDKTDKHDALAVARATLQEQNRLQPVLLENDSEILNILIEHYDNIKGENTRYINRLHAHLKNLEIREKPNLTTKKTLKSIIERAQVDIKTIQGTRWTIAKLLAEKILETMEQLKQLDKQINEVLKPIDLEPLLEIEGLGNYCASKILAIVGNPSLFRSESCFANYAGVAPIPCSSGKNVKYRVNPGGNRQLNSVIFRVMFTQLRIYPPAIEYYEKKQSEGKTAKEAKRCLKRMIARRIFKSLLQIEYFKSA